MAAHSLCMCILYHGGVQVPGDVDFPVGGVLISKAVDFAEQVVQVTIAAWFNCNMGHQ